MQYDYAILETTSIFKYKINTDYSVSTNGNWADITVYRTKFMGDASTGNNYSWQYYNNDGQLILSVENADETYNSDDIAASLSSTKMAKTFYIYDNLGNICFTVSPEAADEYLAGTLNNVLNDLCYIYKYNSKNLLNYKKLPGVEPVYYRYDVYNRLRYTQDGNLRFANPDYWLYTNYDIIGRVTSTGLTLWVDNPTIYEEDIMPPTAAKGYEQVDDYSYMYYDNYDFITEAGLQNYLNYKVYSDYEPVENKRVKGSATGSKVKVLQADTSLPEKWLYSVTYYDEYGRAIQTVSQNNLGGYDISAIKYNFAGSIVKTKTVHTKTNLDNPVTIDHLYDYYGTNELWLKSITESINGGQGEVIEEYTYNPLGQVETKKIGNELQTVDYTYNAKGALTGINNTTTINETDDLFAMNLTYLKNGNIQTQKYATPVTPMQTNTYAYDKMNRLLSVTTTGSKYNEIFSYDLNGNIKTLIRKGQAEVKTKSGTDVLTISGYTLIDNLTYSYKGNKLKWVDDAANVNTALNHDFRDNGAKYSTIKTDYREYIYDNNGNMTSDLNKGITSVEYNYLDLAEEINLGSKGKITYTYTAAGTKLQSVYSEETTRAEALTTDYCGGFVYEGDKLSYILTSYGRIKYEYIYYPDDIAHEELSDDKSIFVRRHREYFLTDHLGNVRVVFARGTDGNAKALQETHYYAHGLQQAGIGFDSSTNEYFYNGKELQEEADLQYLNYGWRQLDPQLGIWHTPDKLAEWYPNQSPYCYAGNNPINRIDINGLTWEDIFDKLWNNPEGGTCSGGGITYFRSNREAYDYGVDHGLGDGIERDYESMAGHSGSSRRSLNFGYKGKPFAYYKRRNSPLAYLSSIFNPKNWFSLETNSDYPNPNVIWEPILYPISQENAAYEYIWNNSFDTEGNVTTENSAFITEEGVLVLPNFRNLKDETRWTYLKTKTETDKRYVYYNDKWIQIYALIHTHPNAKGETYINNADYQLKTLPVFVIGDLGLYGAWNVNGVWYDFDKIDGIDRKTLFESAIVYKALFEIYKNQ